MGLREWQSTLSEMISGASPDLACNAVGLSAKEGESLRKVLKDSGFAYTRSVQRSWCEGRTALGAPLTLGLLNPEARRNVLCEWVSRGHGRNSFFHDETPAFLAFVLGQLSDPVIVSVCRFERALAVARQQEENLSSNLREPDAGRWFEWSPAANLVRFNGDPAKILADAKNGLRANPSKSIQRLLIAPGIPGYAMIAPPQIAVARMILHAGPICLDDLGAKIQDFELAKKLAEWRVIV